MIQPYDTWSSNTWSVLETKADSCIFVNKENKKVINVAIFIDDVLMIINKIFETTLQYYQIIFLKSTIDLGFIFNST